MSTRTAFLICVLVVLKFLDCSGFELLNIFNINELFSSKQSTKVDTDNNNSLDPNQTQALMDQFLQYNRNNGLLGDSKTNPESESQFLSKLDKDGSGKITSSELKRVCYYILLLIYLI